MSQAEWCWIFRGPPIYTKKWFCIFGWIWVCAFNLLGPGQYWRIQQVTICQLWKSTSYHQHCKLRVLSVIGKRENTKKANAKINEKVPKMDILLQADVKMRVWVNVKMWIRSDLETAVTILSKQIPLYWAKCSCALSLSVAPPSPPPLTRLSPKWSSSSSSIMRWSDVFLNI